MSRRVIQFNYKLSNKAGNVLDQSDGEPFAFLEGTKSIIPALERSVVLLQKGDKRRIELAVNEAYGQRQDNLVIQVPFDKLGGTPKVGDRFKGGDEENAPVFSVTSVTATEATLDANHPLAGEDLVFDIEITGIRQATPEETQHGHAHQPGGHHH